MSATTIVNKIDDGGRAYGVSSTLKIKKFGLTPPNHYVDRGVYIADDFGKTQATNSKEFTNKDEVPVGQVTTRGLLTGRATLQFASDTTPECQIGDVFKWVDPDTTNTEAYYFYLDSVERTERKAEEAKQAINFRRVLKPTAFFITVEDPDKPEEGTRFGPINLTALTW